MMSSLLQNFPFMASFIVLSLLLVFSPLNQLEISEHPISYFLTYSSKTSLMLE